MYMCIYIHIYIYILSYPISYRKRSHTSGEVSKMRLRACTIWLAKSRSSSPVRNTLYIYYSICTILSLY